LALASCTPPPPAGIQIFDVWARPAPQSGGTTAVYFRIVNRGDQADRLVGGRAVGAEALEIHETTMEGDMAHMAPLAGIDVPAGATVEIAPGGFHLMLLGLTNPLEPGDHVALTLAFEQAGEIEVEAEVRQP
jgi:copper(I)-binding protein